MYGKSDCLNMEGQQLRTQRPAEIAPKLGAVSEELQVTEKVLSILNDAIGRLEERITFVLSPSSPTGKDSAKSPEEPCELASTLRRNNHSISMLTNRINEIIDRCEL